MPAEAEATPSTASSAAGPGGPPLTERQEARRRRILHTSAQLASRGGFDAVQMREVAESSQVALGTLYRYFPSKQQLYAEVLVTWSESFDTRVRAQTLRETSDADRLRAALRRTVRAYERHPNFFRLISAFEVSAEPGVADRFGTFAGRYTDALADVLVETAPEDRATIAYLTSTVLGSLLRSWSLRGTSISHVYDRLDEMVDLIFSGPRQQA
jgi:AcrR family transcriptional regulator